MQKAVAFEGPCLNDQDVTPQLRANGATVMRLVVDPSHSGQGVQCAAQAYTAGYPLYLALGLNHDWTPAQAAAYVAQTLPQYAPYAWAVSVGNEPDLNDENGAAPPDGVGTICGAAPLLKAAYTTTRTVRYRAWKRVRRHHYRKRVRVWRHRTVTITHPPTWGSTTSCRPRMLGEDYRLFWDAVEPVIAHEAPKAIRVYGEVSPWGTDFLEQGWDGSAPQGVGAVSIHCYDTEWGGLRDIPTFAAWARSKGLPVFCSEMTPVLAPNIPGSNQNTWATWNALVTSVEAASPNVTLTSFYNDPPDLGTYRRAWTVPGAEAA